MLSEASVQEKKRRAAGHAALLVVQLCFALFPIFGKLALGSISPFVLAAIRVVSAAVLLELVTVGLYQTVRPVAALPAADMPFTGNTEQVGWMLYTSYLIPFEIASMLLLVAMIGAIVLAKREL